MCLPHELAISGCLGHVVQRSQSAGRDPGNLVCTLQAFAKVSQWHLLVPRSFQEPGGVHDEGHPEAAVVRRRDSNGLQETPHCTAVLTFGLQSSYQSAGLEMRE